jgi:hypothetical protein
MYFPNDIEKICYDPDHISQVLSEIKGNFHDYFMSFIETDAGNAPSDERFRELAQHFGSTEQLTRKKTNQTKIYRSIIKESNETFEKDRHKYQEILKEDALEEFEDDPNHFKNSVMKNQCPVINATLNNKHAKELDKYRKAFKLADPEDMLTVVQNLHYFAQKYMNETYEEETYELINNVDDLGLRELDEDDYTLHGVIGGGIKSILLYKLYPSVFPNRSREAIWALWYLSGKKTFGCEEDSEFLMIHPVEATTQQNYFYPYGLFGFYAFKIYLLLKKEAEKYDVHINKEYRYVILHAFLTYVARVHEDEINFLRSQVRENSYGGY